jgi:ribosomal protection tetracycline resistance protein
MGVTHGLGAPEAAFTPYGDGTFTAGLRDLLAEGDDTLLADYVTDESTVSYQRLRRELAAQTARARVHPLFFGSAITGAGVATLTSAITELLPATEGDADAPVSGSVFKVERGPAGEKIAYVRLFAGTVRTREVIGASRVTGISVFERGAVVARPAVTAGQIGKLTGLADIRIGDPIGVAARPMAHSFAPPTLETVVVPRRAAEKGALHLALAQLAEQDPLINLRQDDVRQEMFVSLYGEVQKEVIEATLATDFGLAVTFRETTTICVERPNGTGAAAEFVAKEPNPFWATVGLSVGPAPVGSGVTFRLAVELGSMPLAYFTAVEESVRETLRQGLYGWDVPDCLVTVTHSGFAPPLSAAGDFRSLTPLVLMAALRRAGTTVHEPMQRFHLEIPEDSLGAVLQVLAPLRAVADTTVPHDSRHELEGVIPAARVHELQQRLPGLTHGEGVLDSAFDHYRPVRGTPPVRPRSDNNPLNRREYLLRVVRRTTVSQPAAPA